MIFLQKAEISGLNFGDDITDDFYNEIFRSEVEGREQSSIRNLVYIMGSIIGQNESTNYVHNYYGAGFGFSKKAPKNNAIHFVRGPLSEEFLGNKSPFYADAAYITLCFEKYSSFINELKLSPKKGYGYVPHHSNTSSNFSVRFCRENGLKFIDPRRHWKEVLRDLSGCEGVYAEAMHGAIFSDVLRVPWVPVFTTTNLSCFRWLDYCLGAGTSFRPLIYMNLIEKFVFRRNLRAVGSSQKEIMDLYYSEVSKSKLEKSINKRLLRLSRIFSQSRSFEVPENTDWQLTSDKYIRDVSENIYESINNSVRFL